MPGAQYTENHFCVTSYSPLIYPAPPFEYNEYYTSPVSALSELADFFRAMWHLRECGSGYRKILGAINCGPSLLWLLIPTAL